MNGCVNDDDWIRFSTTPASGIARLVCLEGAATIVWAVISYFLLLDFPANTKRLTERERLIAISRLKKGGLQTYVDGDLRMGRLKSFRLAIVDWRTVGFVLGYMASDSTHIPP